MEEIISKVFNHPKATELKFMYYKQCHVQPMVFFKAVQMQQKHEQSHRVIAVQGLINILCLNLLCEKHFLKLLQYYQLRGLIRQMFAALQRSDTIY
jgi:hypothetical protein